MYRISMTGEPDKYVTLDNMCNNPGAILSCALSDTHNGVTATMNGKSSTVYGTGTEEPITLDKDICTSIFSKTVIVEDLSINHHQEITIGELYNGYLAAMFTGAVGEDTPHCMYAAARAAITGEVTKFDTLTYTPRKDN